MKIQSSLTGFQPWFLRRLTVWCCKQLEMPARGVRAVFRNSRSCWGGCARGWRRQITVCVGDAKWFPKQAKELHVADRLECLVWVTAHELAHVMQYAQRTRTRLQGGYGGSEKSTDWHAVPIVEAFRAQRESLLAQWSAEPVMAIRPVVSVTDRRARKARSDLERWQRKLRLATTKVRKLKLRVKYYAKNSPSP